jgi:DNA-binding response OmpR family regulator
MAKKILIIEDDKSMARALEFKLTRAGFEVKSTGNGEDGLAILASENFSLILLDLIMPKVDGFKVLETLKERQNKTPIIVLSNLSQDQDEKHVLELGAEEFLIKSNTPISKIAERVKNKLGVL